VTEQNLHIVVYYHGGDDSVDAIYRELDDLDVPYERIEISSQPHDVTEHLSKAGGGSPRSPTVSINGELLVQPSSANVMSAIMHARSAGFYL
jgi:hypothetical protein